MASLVHFRGWDSLARSGPYSVVLADPPWSYYGSPDKWAAAGKFYSLLSDDDLSKLPIQTILCKEAIVFLWCTSSSLERAISCLRGWGLFYRGVAFVWVKTARSGRPIGAQGVRPSITKPLTEFVIAGAKSERGRPLPLSDEGISQTIFAPRGRHSEKPKAVNAALEQMYPGDRKAELFARDQRSGWTCWGDELEVCDQAPSSQDEQIYLRNVSNAPSS
jgi:N6-adenosine-specific RNA methylase IME4